MHKNEGHSFFTYYSDVACLVSCRYYRIEIAIKLPIQIIHLYIIWTFSWVLFHFFCRMQKAVVPVLVMMNNHSLKRNV